MMWKWYKVSRNGGRTAVWARSEQEALELHAAYSQQLSIYPGTTVNEISAEEAETYWYKIR